MWKLLQEKHVWFKSLALFEKKLILLVLVTQKSLVTQSDGPY